MKNLFKYLIVSIIAFTTILTVLPITQAHASEQVYTDSPEMAGTIVTVDNAGNIVSTFEEGVLNVDGEIAYCIDINTQFQSGYKTRYNATEKLSNDQIADVALSLEYVKQYANRHPELTHKQVYLLEQSIVWRNLSVHLGWGYDNVRADYSEVPESIQSEVYNNAKTFVTQNKDRYDYGQAWRINRLTISKTVTLINVAVPI